MIFRSTRNRPHEHPAPADGSDSADSGSGGALSRPPRRSGRRVMLGVAAVIVALAAGISAVVVSRHGDAAAGGEARASGIPAGISTRLANLMQASSLPRPAAPGFTLTDQAGRTMGLASFRGKVVVLEFMDDHCHDICPIVSQEFVDAYHDLGPLASKVVFAAVNVNPYYPSVRAVAAFSAEQKLTTIPSWHFFTGPVPALRKIWGAYHVDVQAGNAQSLVHTSVVYVIDSRGRERYLAMPEDDHTKSGAAYLPASQISGWGRGIALLAGSLAR